MFYDNELKIWRAKGQPPPEVAAPVGPPPRGPSPVPNDPSATMPAGPPRVGQATPGGNQSGVQSRYVNTLTPQR